MVRPKEKSSLLHGDEVTLHRNWSCTTINVNTSILLIESSLKYVIMSLNRPNNVPWSRITRAMRGERRRLLPAEALYEEMSFRGLTVAIE